jgi:hypothetical protein
MAFKLTYTDGQSDDYDDETKWEVEGGVLKMGKKSGDWTVLVSPAHWATVELAQDQREDQDKNRGGEENHAEDHDSDEAEDEKSADDDRVEAS